MAIRFVPLGVVLQRLDRFSYRLPLKFNYEGLVAYCDTPLDDLEGLDKVDDQKAKDLELEFYDWIICQRSNGTYTTKPEAFYTPVFLRRYLNMCDELKLPVRRLFVDYNGEEALWKFDRPNGLLPGYEVCNAPRDPEVICSLDMDRFAVHRAELNRIGLFKTPEGACSFKKDYEEFYREQEKYYRSDQLFDLNLHIFRIYEMEEYPDFLL